MRVFSAEHLLDICITILETKSVPNNEAEIIAEILVQANLRGQDGHGGLLLPGYLERVTRGQIKCGVQIDLEKETASTALVNGNWGFGQVVGVRAMEVAIQKAKHHTISLAGISNCNHLGLVAHYPMMALKHDMIGLTLYNSPFEPG